MCKMPEQREILDELASVLEQEFPGKSSKHYLKAAKALAKKAHDLGFQPVDVMIGILAAQKHGVRAKLEGDEMVS